MVFGHLGPLNEPDATATEQAKEEATVIALARRSFQTLQGREPEDSTS